MGERRKVRFLMIQQLLLSINYRFLMESSHFVIRTCAEGVVLKRMVVSECWYRLEVVAYS